MTIAGRLTWLYVPGDRRDRMAAALAGGGRWRPDDLQMVRELPPAVGVR